MNADRHALNAVLDYARMIEAELERMDRARNDLISDNRKLRSQLAEIHNSVIGRGQTREAERCDDEPQR